MINTKLLVQQLNNFMKGSTAASEARVQVKLPKGELYSVDGYFDIKRISLLQNNLIGTRESHRIVFEVTSEAWKMQKPKIKL